MEEHLHKHLAKNIMKLKLRTPLEWVEIEDIESNEDIKAKARYLYWACYRGHVNLVKHIIENDKISPFARVYESRSPMMASLIGKMASLKGQEYLDHDRQELSKLITNRA